MQRTLVLLKPDCIHRRLVGRLIDRFEQKGLRIVAMKFLVPPRDLAERHYAVHRERPFYESLLQFVTSGPVVAMVLEGPEAIYVVRNMMGATNGAKAAAGTIRGDFGVSTSKNLIHGSDAPDSAATEIALWFKPEELVEFEPVDRHWILGS